MDGACNQLQEKKTENENKKRRFTGERALEDSASAKLAHKLNILPRRVEDNEVGC
jgi:hypothetical protein